MYFSGVLLPVKRNISFYTSNIGVIYNWKKNRKFNSLGQRTQMFSFLLHVVPLAFVTKNSTNLFPFIKKKYFPSIYSFVSESFFNPNMWYILQTLWENRRNSIKRICFYIKKKGPSCKINVVGHLGNRIKF